MYKMPVNVKKNENIGNWGWDRFNNIGEGRMDLDDTTFCQVWGSNVLSLDVDDIVERSLEEPFFWTTIHFHYHKTRFLGTLPPYSPLCNKNVDI